MRLTVNQFGPFPDIFGTRPIPYSKAYNYLDALKRRGYNPRQRRWGRCSLTNCPHIFGLYYKNRGARLENLARKKSRGYTPRAQSHLQIKEITYLTQRKPTSLLVAVGISAPRKETRTSSACELQDPPRNTREFSILPYTSEHHSHTFPAISDKP